MEPVAHGTSEESATAATTNTRRFSYTERARHRNVAQCIRVPDRLAHTALQVCPLHFTLSRTAWPITHFRFVHLVNKFPLALPVAENNIDPLPSGP